MKFKSGVELTPDTGVTVAALLLAGGATTPLVIGDFAATAAGALGSTWTTVFSCFSKLPLVPAENEGQYNQA